MPRNSCGYWPQIYEIDLLVSSNKRDEQEACVDSSKIEDEADQKGCLIPNGMQYMGYLLFFIRIYGIEEGYLITFRTPSSSSEINRKSTTTAKLGIYGLSDSEIAVHLNKSQQAVSKSYKKALNKLRKIIENV
ncbi:sigma-70 family RNA polymerase sigma factor [Aneurinibacillus aneurinilyticus]|uniref:RNA polymerase sigma-70 region 4 domain-containing protein n=1 Tax=Aneurinibacillus aneurinilyticus ATCC 12856 TaxID=649747 RepID=U1Y979_ANEAE|nr:sigma-70 family RNA polymerase sigma factor [Aneurinibacillus aneurinilyticus]ERI07366.1 hypothetical protein HMPREF0083_04547 [Aneurinibacillus aneurinilyticus ATCC 12856]MED0707566.1 sigma-70 family RNA polymerase sigma factor [Aneurinibacillus aneurinilyticus]MED0723933.1 sigma-70 family RNA polymerase sigma factor [Aneurinibacillus aneurinilyticus]MED0735022.1 sigma-70 family RNA polymerase sigma factor [Aneurinibacillus aneurinilyticus]MED0739395.1 sigma-70 family RNA polymerase sigma 